MRKLLLAGLICMAIGCRKGRSVSTEVAPRSVAVSAPPVVSAPPAGALKAEWRPETRGRAFDLALAEQTLSFCDDRGPRQFSLVAGEETTGTQACPKDDDNEDASKSCPDEVEVIGNPDGGGNDVLTFGAAGYRLKGLMSACAGAGTKIVVSTGKQVLLIDSGTNKASIVSPDGAERVAIGPGWVAWRTLESERPLHVRSLASIHPSKEAGQ